MQKPKYGRTMDLYSGETTFSIDQLIYNFL